MIGVTAIFESEDRASSLLQVLNDRGWNPNRIGVTRSEEGEVGVIVEADESHYEEMATLMREHGASNVEIDMTGLKRDSAGRPTLTDSEPPTPHDAG